MDAKAKKTISTKSEDDANGVGTSEFSRIRCKRNVIEKINEQEECYVKIHTKKSQFRFSELVPFVHPENNLIPFTLTSTSLKICQQI